MCILQALVKFVVVFVEKYDNRDGSLISMCFQRNVVVNRYEEMEFPERAFILELSAAFCRSAVQK